MNKMKATNFSKLFTFAALLTGSALISVSLTGCAGNKKQEKTQSEATVSTLPALDVKGTEIPSDAFAGKANLTKFSIPENITIVRSGAFKGCPEITEVECPASLASIDQEGFANCPKLEKITLPDGMKIICDNAFTNCPSLKNIKLPEKCYCVGIGAFENCTGLTDITFTLNLQMLCERAFAGCTSLKRVLLPITVQDVHETAFNNCPNVEEIAIPGGNTRRNIFKIFRDSPNLKKLYLLSLESYDFPKTNPIAGFPNKQCTVYVRDAQLEDYRARDSWKGFAEILPLSQSGIYDAEGNLK